MSEEKSRLAADFARALEERDPAVLKHIVETIENIKSLAEQAGICQGRTAKTGKSPSTEFEASNSLAIPEEVRIFCAAAMAGMRKASAAVEAMIEYFDAMLADERIKTVPFIHEPLKKIYDAIMDSSVAAVDSALLRQNEIAPALGKRGAKQRHLSDRQAREKVIAAWQSGSYRTKAACAKAMAPKVNRSEETIRRWLRAGEIRKQTGR